jgi:hypothetical protein
LASLLERRAEDSLELFAADARHLRHEDIGSFRIQARADIPRLLSLSGSETQFNMRQTDSLS